MTTSQQNPASGQPDPDAFDLDAYIAARDSVDRTVNRFLFWGSLGGAISSIAFEHYNIAFLCLLVLFIYLLKTMRNFFYALAPRMPSTAELVREAQYAHFKQRMYTDAQMRGEPIANRTITQDDAMNYALGSIGVVMPFQDFDEPF
jgi:hypothetical protein